MRRIRSHLTYANVMATLAVFIALGGGTTAVALSGSNTVFTDDIANDTQPAGGGNPAGGLTAPDLRAGSVGTSEVAANSLTGTDVNEATLNLAAGAWHEVGAAGEPAFETNLDCSWNNFDTNHNSTAFLRDRFGFVHLKGLVDADDVSGSFCDFINVEDTVIFQLPFGYRPAKTEVISTISNSALGQLLIHNSGELSVVDPPTTEANAKEWLSLDGISFRCAPSGANGCP